MEKSDTTNFDTDLDDDETDRLQSHVLPRISFNHKLAAHRNNRLNQTFGQINVLFQSTKENESDHDTLVSLPNKSLSNNGRLQIYDNSCKMLDIAIDWQIRALLAGDNITISNRSLGYNDIRAFATAIEENLQSLVLSCVGLTSRSLNILCQGLKKCVNLKFLDLSYNRIDRKAFDILIDRIKHLPSLLCLSLINCGIRDSYGRCIGDLCRHKMLMELNLSGNQFEEMACIFIGNALTENQSLMYLNMSWNLIRSFASIALFRGFEINKTITEFDISWSNLSYDGSVALRRVLAVNKILQRLNISNCNIDWTSAKLISEGLQKNSTLNVINLAFNPLTTHGVQFIVQGLIHEKSAVSTLDLSGIAVFSDTVRLAEKIANERQFIMTYDIEVSVQDMIGRQKVTKADSVRKIIQHMDEQKWRPMDYFRILNSKRKLQLHNESRNTHISKTENNKTENYQQQHPMDDLSVEPLTLKNLNDVIYRQKLRDRLQKARLEQQEQDIKRRNQKILQTVNQHFPDIRTKSRKDKYKRSTEHLSKPGSSYEKKKL